MVPGDKGYLFSKKGFSAVEFVAGAGLNLLLRHPGNHRRSRFKPAPAPHIHIPERTQKGFSAVELSIGLTVAAALIAVTLAGTGLVKQSRLSQVIEEVNTFSTAISEFEEIYGSLPGDTANVSGLPTASPAAVAGNGNGVIDSSETLQLWRHLSIAGLIPGNFDGSSTYIPGRGVPAGPIQGSGYSIHIPTVNEGLSNQAIIFDFSGYSSTSTTLPILTPEQAETLDKQIDDGLPSSGIIQAYAGDGAAAGSCTNNNTYTLSQTATTCVLRIITRQRQTIEEGSTQVSCGAIGQNRISSTKTCPAGYTGHIMETCQEDGSWGNAQPFCEAVKCSEKHGYGDTRTLNCPTGYGGTGITYTCSASGIWLETSNTCTVTSGDSCTYEGTQKILRCLFGKTGKITLQCTSGIWTTTQDTCTAIQCSANAIGTTRQATINCNRDTSYSGSYTGAITETCTMDTTWKPTKNTCTPVYSTCNASAPEPDNDGLGVNMRDIGCPPGEDGQHIQKCVDETTDHWVTAKNTCTPVTCGTETIGTARSASGSLSCPGNQEGEVIEVCQENGTWQTSNGNCTATCNGTKDRAGNALWPNATAGTSNVVAVGCINGYTGVAQRNCNANGEWEAPLQSCGISPINVNGLELWLDGKDTNVLFTGDTCTGAVSNGSSVGCWQDKSGKAYHMKQSTSGNKPQFLTSGINSKNAVHFTRSGSDYMTGTTTGFAYSGTLPYSYFVVMDPLAFPSGGPMHILSKWNNGSQGVLALLINTGGVLLAQRNISPFGTASASSINLNPSIVSVTYDSTTLTLFYNGNQENAVAHGSTGAATTIPFCVGCFYSAGSPTNFFDGEIGEVLMYNRAVNATERSQIERYLAQKWDITLNSAASLGTPDTVANLVLWLDASDPGGEGASQSTNNRVNGAAISEWKDKSKKFHHAVQTTVSKQPTYITNALNSKPIIRFNGYTDYMDIPVHSDLNASDMTVIAVVKSLDTTSATQDIVVSQSSLSGYRLGMDSSNNWKGSISSASIENTCCGSNAATFMQPKILTFTFNNSLQSLYLNGASAGTPTTHTSYSQNAIKDGRIGAKDNIGTPVNFFFGDIAEIIIYSRVINTTERNSVESYLGTKWGITVSP